MSSEVELLSCPFCGSTDLGDQGPSFTQIMCNSCGAHEYDQPSREAAIAAWNRRSASPSIGRVGVKALEWTEGTAQSSGLAPFGAWYFVHERDGGWFIHYGNNTPHASRDEAKAAAQADYEARILSTLVYHEEPAGDTQGAAVAWRWRAKVKGEWSLWSTVEVDPNDWTWRDYWEDLEVAPLYLHPAALVSPPDNGEAAEHVTEVIVEPFTDSIVLLMTGEGETLSAILDTSCAIELRDKLAAALQSHNEGGE